MKLVTLDYNIPQEMALSSREAFQVGQWVCFLLADERVLAITPEAAESLLALHLAPGEPFRIVQRHRSSEGGVPYYEIWLTAQAEQMRAVEEIRDETGHDLTDLLTRSIEMARQKKGPAIARTPESAKPANPPVELKPAKWPIQAKPAQNGRIPMNVAAKEIIRFARQAAKEAGENWGDAAMQDWSSTLLISAQKLGFIGMWEREEEQGANAA